MQERCFLVTTTTFCCYRQGTLFSWNAGLTNALSLALINTLPLPRTSLMPRAWRNSRLICAGKHKLHPGKGDEGGDLAGRKVAPPVSITGLMSDCLPKLQPASHTFCWLFFYESSTSLLPIWWHETSKNILEGRGDRSPSPQRLPLWHAHILSLDDEMTSGFMFMKHDVKTQTRYVAKLRQQATKGWGVSGTQQLLLLNTLKQKPVFNVISWHYFDTSRTLV